MRVVRIGFLSSQGVFLVFVICMLFTGFVHAQSVAGQRTENEASKLAGTWRVVRVSQPEELPYLIIRNVVTGSVENTCSSRILEQIRGAKPGDTITIEAADHILCNPATDKGCQLFNRWCFVSCHWFGKG